MSQRTLERGAGQVGSLGSGKHFVEASDAYKNIDAVVEAAEGVGRRRMVARLTPLGVVKG